MYKSRIMEILQSRLKAETEWVTPLPILVNLKFNKNIESTRNVRILCAGLIEFEVIDMTILPSRSYTLDLDKKLCDCGMWVIVWRLLSACSMFYFAYEFFLI